MAQSEIRECLENPTVALQFVRNGRQKEQHLGNTQEALEAIKQGIPRATQGDTTMTPRRAPRVIPWCHAHNAPMTQIVCLSLLINALPQNHRVKPTYSVGASLPPPVHISIEIHYRCLYRCYLRRCLRQDDHAGCSTQEDSIDYLKITYTDSHRMTVVEL